MTTPTRRLAALAAVALACAACSKLPASSSTATTAAPTTTIQGASTPALTKAANYRAQLTYLLVEHVFLLSRVTGQVVNGASSAPTSTTAAPTTTTEATTTTTAAAGKSSTTTTSSSTPSSTQAATTTTAAPATGAVQTPDDAGAALDGNSHDLADLLAQAQGYGSAFGSAFYDLWTQRIGDIANYATAKAAKDTKGAQAATTALGTNATAIGTLVHQSNKYIAVTTVKTDGLADELGTDNSAVTTFVDSQASNTTTATADVVSAAEQVRHTAVVLAAAASKLDPDQFPGTATGTAANLRASVTSALAEHVALAGLTIDQLVKGQAGGAQRAALDANTAQLANIVTVNFGDPAARQFRTVWGKYVSSLTDLARSKGGSGTAPDLSGVGAQIGDFFGQQSPQLSASTIGADAQKMVDALAGYVSAASSGAQAVTQLRVAAATVPKLGSDIAEGIAETKPAQYLP